MEALVAIQMEALHNLRHAAQDLENENYFECNIVETKLEMLEEKYKEFKEGHKKIISKACRKRQEAYFTEGVFEDYEAEYVRYKSMLREVLVSLKKEAFEEWQEPNEDTIDEDDECKCDENSYSDENEENGDEENDEGNKSDDSNDDEEPKKESDGSPDKEKPKKKCRFCLSSLLSLKLNL